MKPDILHKGSQVWLDLDPFYPQNYQQPNTVFKSWAIALQTLGSDINYSTLMGVSGAAFRFQLHEEWCPSSPHPRCGYNCAQVAMDELHLDTVINIVNTVKDDLVGAVPLVVESINSKVPVVACGLETGMIVGYDNLNGQISFLYRGPYSNKGDGMQVISVDQIRQAPGELRIFHSVPPKPDEQVLKKSLNLALELALHPLVDKYSLGFTALQNWIEGLSDEQYVRELASKDGIAPLSNANAHMYHSLIDARQAASMYLQSVAPVYNGNHSAWINVAQDFKSAAAVLENAFDNVVWGWQINQGLKEWTSEKRLAQAKILRQFLDIEKTNWERMSNLIN